MKNKIKYSIAWIIIWSIWITSAISWPAAPSWEPTNGLFMTYINKMLVDSWVTTTDGKIKKALDADTLWSWVVTVSGWNVWVNNINPQAKLDIVWKLKTTWLQITTWANTGYILMSDTNGNWSWQPNDYKLYVKALNEWNSTYWSNCFLMADTTVRCVWYNGHWQLWIGDAAAHRYLVSTPPIKWVKKLISGSLTNYALMENWTIYAWWYNAQWEIWYWWTSNIYYPYPVSWITTATDLVIWRSVNSYNHACALLADKTVRCWWINGNGYLWVWDTADRYTPVDIWLSNVVSIKATTKWNEWATCALLWDGTVKCWGYNNYGQLWVGDATARYTPTLVPGLTNVRSIYVWDRQTCAVLTDNVTLKCWGYNWYGNLWDGTVTARYSPTTIATWWAPIKDVVTSMNDYNSTWVLFTDWTIRSTWYSWYGQLGLGDATARSNLTPIPWITNAIKIVSSWHWSYQTVCALLWDGTVKCWGYNWYGQIWVGDVSARYSPVSVANVNNAVDINMQWYSNTQYTCALLVNWSVKCWGYNWYGQLGQWDVQAYYMPMTVKNLNAE